ncbi:helicase-associated domain-containing protein [Tsukamurella sp. 1534]|uniref:helicase-associated domain-containing protein n=1 Tax=Tsukamurella sp. 1534 TaxID=1151061 RepID=UPI000306A7F0|nr:helicase-associated domain-containing protein [Tsukamurella sp. 1534]
MSSNAGSVTPAALLTEWLRGRDDARIAALLDARRDVAAPVPAGFGVLATRLLSPSSLGRVAEQLNLLDLAVLEVVLGSGGATPDAVARALRGRALKKQVVASVEKLRTRALVWGEEDLRTSPAVRDAMPWRTPQLTSPRDVLEIDGALAGAGEDERALLDRLAEGSPLGRTAAAGPGTSAEHPVQRLLAAGLLARVDHQTVEMPWEVRARLRGEPPIGASLKPPALDGPPVPGADGAGAVAALELLRHADDVLSVLGRVPAARVKAGGIGIRELRRVAKAAELDEDRAALVIELLAAAGLVGEGELEDSDDSVFAPTVSVDEWQRQQPADRWALLARTWLELRRQPALIGSRGEEGIVGPLHRAARSTVAPQDRRAVLAALAAAPAGAAPDPASLHAAIRFAHPAWYRRLTLDAIAGIVAQAQVVGLVAGGALTSAGRAAAAGGETAAAMAAALPAPVEEFLLQADLTLTIPGPTTHDFAAAVELVADLESAGGAAVYRVTDASVRRALDAGRTSAEVHAFFAAHAVTPVPQGLTYLVDDVARRHGALRAGVASSFLRSDDPSLIAAVLASPAADLLALRAIAPTVAICQAPLAELVAGLSAAGFAAAAEDSRGVVVDLRPSSIRLPVPRPRPPAAQPTPEQLADAVVQIRRQDSPSDGARTSGPELMTLLQSAAGDGRTVRLGYVDANGVYTRHVVVPESVRHGQLTAVDGDAPRRFALHRVTNAEFAD